MSSSTKIVKSPQEIAVMLTDFDPILGAVITRTETVEIKPSQDYFVSLVESIISQQLSVKVSDVIYARFEALFTDKLITPEQILKLEAEVMRSVGMSYAKIKYVKSLAEHVTLNPQIFESFENMSEEEIIIELTKVKGIGRWTAEMFLMFTMGREDIFSSGDLGLRNALKKLYQLEDLTAKDIETITDKWRPYRSYASCYLWRSLDQKILME